MAIRNINICFSKPHPHAELMLEYAKDAMETDTPHERWEYTNESINGWADCAGNSQQGCSR